MFPIAVALLLLTITMFDSFLINGRISGYIPEFIIEILGGEVIITDVPIIVFPLFTKIITIMSLIFILVIYKAREIKKSKF